MGNVTVGKYLYYQPEKKRFYLTDEAEQIVYSKKDLITGHSGASKWAHSMFCQTLDFYGGTYMYEKKLENEKTTVENAAKWLEVNNKEDWFRKAVNLFEALIDIAPNLNEE